MGTANSLNSNSVGLANYDGAGTWTGVTVTDHAVLIGGLNNNITSLLLTNGQLAIGNTGNDPTAATLTAGTGVSIANAPGSITINSTGGGLTWNVVTTNTAAVANNGYIANKAGLVVFTLPVTSAVGDTFAFTNLNTPLGWQIVYNTGQNIRFGTVTSTTTTGSLASINLGDTVYLVTVVANTTFFVTTAIGNITVT